MELTTEVGNGKAGKPVSVPAEKDISLLAKIRQQWEAAGGPERAAKVEKRDKATIEAMKREVTPLVKSLKASMSALASAKKALADAEEREQATLLALAQVTGGKPITVDGERFEFGCRATTIFLKERIKENELSL